VGNHSSGTAVTSILKRPTRRRRGPRHSLPIWSCSRWGLPCHKLLPVARCALTAPFHPYLPSLVIVEAGGIFSVALSVGSRPPGVTWHPALWSPDFPPFRLKRKRDCLADSRDHCPLPLISLIVFMHTERYMLVTQLTVILITGKHLCATRHSIERQPGQPGRLANTPTVPGPFDAHWTMLHLYCLHSHQQ
jgi:hypothetical protein